MAKKVTDKETKQTTKAEEANILQTDQMKEHLENLVEMAKKNDNTQKSRAGSAAFLRCRMGWRSIAQS